LYGVEHKSTYLIDRHEVSILE